MTDRTLRDRLRAIDPAANNAADPVKREALLQRLHALDEPVIDDVERRHVSRPRLARPAVAGLALTVLIVVGVVAGWARTGDVREPFAARAYAAAAAPVDRVLHARIRASERDRDGRETSGRTDEWWIRPGNAGYVHLIDSTLDEQVRRTVISATRTQRTTWIDGRQVETVKGSPQPAREGVFDPNAQLRRLYDSGTLRDAGAAALNGQPTRRLDAQNGDSQITYDVDPTSLKPRRTTVVVMDPTTGKTRASTTYDIELLEQTTAAPDPQTLLAP